MKQFLNPPPEIINIHEAKTYLSRIVEEVKIYGKPVIIAKAGKPQVQIIPLVPEIQTEPSLFGFMLHENNQIHQLSELIDEFDKNIPI